MVRPRVVITDHIFPSRAMEREAMAGVGADLVIGNCSTEAEVAELVRGADAVLTTFAPVKEQAVAAMTGCKVIARYGVGVDNVAVEAATKKGIYVCNVPDYCVEEVAEHTLALMLALARRITVLDRDVKAGSWDYRPFRPIQRISGQVLGLVGLGRIARAVGQRAAAFGMKVVAFDPYVQPGSPAAADFALMNFDDLIAAADFISVHCPLSPDTRGLLGARSFERMKPTAFLVNCARGGIVDEQALAEALQSGRIAGAGLDVLSKEPMPPDHPLLRSPNVILTPHTAFYSEESTLELQRRAVDEVVRSLTGHPQRSPVNHPVGR